MEGIDIAETTWRYYVERALGATEWTNALDILEAIWDSRKFELAGNHKAPDKSTISKWRSNGAPRNPYKKNQLAIVAAIKIRLEAKAGEKDALEALQKLAVVWEITHADAASQSTSSQVIDDLFGSPITIPNDNNREVIERLSSDHSLVGKYLSIRYGFHSGETDQPLVCELTEFQRSGKSITFKHIFLDAGGQERAFTGEVLKFGAQLLCLGVTQQGSDTGRFRVATILLRDEGGPNTIYNHFRWGLLTSDTPDGTVQNPACARVMMRKLHRETGDIVLGPISLESASSYFSELPIGEFKALVSNEIRKYPVNLGHRHSESGTVAADRVLKVSQTQSNDVANRLDLSSRHFFQSD